MVASIDIDEKRAYTINETCAILGMHRNTLRRYTKAGKIVPQTREADGRALYNGSDIARLVRTTI